MKKTEYLARMKKSLIAGDYSERKIIQLKWKIKTKTQNNRSN